MKFRWIKKLFRPPFVGELEDGQRVYSKMKVKSVTPQLIIFVNGSTIAPHRMNVVGGKIHIEQAGGSSSIDIK